MQPAEIFELLNLICAKDISEFELEREGLRVRVVKAVPASRSDIAMSERLVEHVVLPSVSSAPVVTESDLSVVKAPMVGTFFRSSGPSTEPFVKVGDRIKKGQVLCIIEAMKLMNEIESEIAGVLAEAVVENGQPVEFGEALFRIRPDR